MNTDLFGTPTPHSGSPTPDEAAGRVTNDIEEVVAVLRLAISEGYTVTGTRRHVWRRLDGSGIEPVARHEADTVRQLLDAEWLTVGATHGYQLQGSDVVGRAVLVPTTARQWLVRRDSHRRLGQPGSPR